LSVVTSVLMDKLVYEGAMNRHIENFHSGVQSTKAKGLSVSDFPFELLPPGSWEFRQAFERDWNPHES
jgi:hypothetical protein